MTLNKFFAFFIYLVNFIGGVWVFNIADQDNKVILFYLIFVFANAQGLYLNYKIMRFKEKLNESN